MEKILLPTNCETREEVRACRPQVIVQSHSLGVTIKDDEVSHSPSWSIQADNEARQTQHRSSRQSKVTIESQETSYTAISQSMALMESQFPISDRTRPLLRQEAIEPERMNANMQAEQKTEERSEGFAALQGFL